MAEDVADRLRWELTRRKISARQMARFMDVSSTALKRWLDREGKPDPAYCQKIATYLNEPVEVILRLAGHLPPLPEPAPGELREERSQYAAEIRNLARAMSEKSMARWLAVGRALADFDAEREA